MAQIKEFQGYRPSPSDAAMVAELPYDVVSSEEARMIADKNPKSFFHISKPEVDLPSDIDHYDDAVYKKGKANLERFIADGVLKKEKDPVLYLYTLIMGGREQTGLMACLSIDDYLNDVIKKHELTREDKERDRMRHLDVLSAQTGLVFTFYREDGAGRDLYTKAAGITPEYDFTATDGVRHVIRIIRDGGLIEGFRKLLAPKDLYIADGHHRAASAVRVGMERRKRAGAGEHEWFLSVVFPHDQLKILAYNRVVKDLNGLSVDEFLARVGEDYTVEATSNPVPEKRSQICMYLDGGWYSLKPRFIVEGDPVGRLDVSVLQKRVLEPILGISDPRKDPRIDFIGGIRGTGELKNLVDDGTFRVAFSLYPTSIHDLIEVSDAGSLMPPKSTWFEPKLRSGLVIHMI